MESDQLNSLAGQIKGETFLGTKALQQCKLEEAIDHFSSAYQAACKTDDDYVKRACAFNLGAAYIANHNPVNGIKFLKKSLTPDHSDTSQTNGDLYYNFGLAYELLGGESEAAKHFELALEEYQKSNDLRMAAEVASRIGALYMSLSELLQAARAYGVAATSYAALSDGTNQALSLSQQVRALLKAGKMTDALHLADDCVLVCQTNEQNEALSKIYNELGLVYTQCADYIQAQKCFELALPLCRGPETNTKQEAVILQNLGATYNSLGEYQRAVSFHESAMMMHAKLNNRNAQGQCFLNLAYAYSRLGDTDNSGECYLHALQAAKDTDDMHSQWQALEGLGAVHSHTGNYHRAVKYFQQAIYILSKSGEANTVAHERLIVKLNHALDCNLPASSPQQNMVSSPVISPLQERPQKQRVRQHTEARANVLSGKKIPYEFDRIAMGLGEYDVDSDFAVSNDRRPRNNSLDEVDRNMRHSARSRRHHHYNRQNRSSLSSGQDYQSSSEKQQAAQKRVPRRQSSRRKLVEGGGRRSAHLNPILKTERCEDEKRNELNGTDQNSDSDQHHRLELIKSDRHGELMAAVPAPSQAVSPELDAKTDTETEMNTPCKDGNTSESDSYISDQAGVKEQDDSERQSDPDEGLSPQSTGNTNVELERYQNELKKIDQQESATHSEQSATGLESEIEAESNPEPGFSGTIGAPDYTAPIPPGTHPPLHQTYVQPVDDPSPSNNKLKVSVPDDDDPTYQRISSLIPDAVPQVSVNVRDSQPTLPHPPISQLSTAEQEAFLKEYRQHHHENTREHVGRPEDDALLLPQRKVSKTKSKACNIM